VQDAWQKSYNQNHDVCFDFDQIENFDRAQLTPDT